MVFRITHREQGLYLMNDGKGYIPTLSYEMSPLFYTIEDAYNFMMTFGLYSKGWEIEQIMTDASIHVHRMKMAYSLPRISRRSCI